jgi:hypothetical protein
MADTSSGKPAFPAFRNCHMPLPAENKPCITKSG